MKFPALDRQKEIYLNGFAGIKPLRFLFQLVLWMILQK